jgi:hypothetical protein
LNIEHFGRLFREFWDKDEDKQLSPGKMWEKTMNVRYQGLTFWQVPVLQLLSLAKGITIGLGSYRFTGHRVPFLVSMVVLLRMDLRMEISMYIPPIHSLSLPVCLGCDQGPLGLSRSA